MVCLVNPLSGEASGPVKLTGSVALTDEFTRGTFNASTATFTPDGEGSSEDTGEDTGEG